MVRSVPGGFLPAHTGPTHFLNTPAATIACRLKISRVISQVQPAAAKLNGPSSVCEPRQGKTRIRVDRPARQAAVSVFKSGLPAAHPFQLVLARAMRQPCCSHLVLACRQCRLIRIKVCATDRRFPKRPVGFRDAVREPLPRQCSSLQFASTRAHDYLVCGKGSPEETV